MKTKSQIKEALERIQSEDDYAKGVEEALMWVIGELYDDEFVYADDEM